MAIKGHAGSAIKSVLPSALCAVTLAISGAANGVIFTGLGDSFAEISPDGSFAYNSTSRWTATGGWETWDSYSGGILTGGVSDVSFDGSVVVGSTGGVIYRWTAAAGMTSIEASLSSSLVNVSADGSVLAGTRSDDLTGNSQAFRWTAATGSVDLGTTGGSQSTFTTNISADGRVVIGSDPNVDASSPDLDTGYWTADGTWIGLTSALDDFIATSSDGSVIVGDFFGGRGVFRWTETDGFGDLDSPSPFRESANDISYDGSTVVGQEVWLSDIQNGAWVWDALNGRRSVQDLLTAEGHDLTGWDLASADSISADGSIITGFGIGPNGIREAWIVDFSAVPLPAAVWLFGFGLLGLITAAGRKPT